MVRSSVAQLLVALLTITGCPAEHVAEAPVAPPPTAASTARATTTVAPPAPAAHAARVVQFAMGRARRCAVRADGAVVCWGKCADFVPGCAGVSERPARVAGIDDALEVAGYDGGWCARRRDGSIACWPEGKRATPVPGVAGVIDLSPTCALLAGGGVTCWSDEAGGAMTKVAGLLEVLRLSHDWRCAIDRAGTVSCWGQSMYPLLDYVPDGGVDAPGRVRGLAKADEVDVGLFLGACARAGGEIWCWGGEHEETRPLHRLAGVATAVQIAVTEYNACARLADGGVVCWGLNSSGQLGVANDGDGGVAFAGDPVRVEGVTEAVDVRVGSGEPCGGCGSACALTSKGDVFCWGGDGGAVPTRVDLTTTE